jgi:hypothetical protein
VRRISLTHEQMLARRVRRWSSMCAERSGRTRGRAAPARLVVIGLVGTVIAHRARSSSHRSPNSLQNTNGDMATRGASDPEPWRCQCKDAHAAEHGRGIVSHGLLSLTELAFLAVYEGDDARAGRLFQKSIEVQRQLGILLSSRIACLEWRSSPPKAGRSLRRGCSGRRRVCGTFSAQIRAGNPRFGSVAGPNERLRQSARGSAKSGSQRRGRKERL